MRTGTRRGVALAGAVLAAVGMVAGCSSGGETAGEGLDGQSAGGDTESRLDAPVQGAAAPEAAPGVAHDELRSLNRPAAPGRAVIRRGEIAIVTEEMNRARLDIEDLLGEHGGYIASEDTANDRRGRPESSVLVLRVPEPGFDEVMRELAAIGSTRQAERTSEDVTAELVDVESRVATQEASLARLRGFLGQAADVDDMIRIESEIAQRQADLESLKAQQKYLRDNTAMSRVTVRLRTPAAPPPPPVEEEQGFLAGLGSGWTALKAVLVGAATVAGALLPFTVAAALVGVPVWLLVRSSRRRHTAPEPVTPDA